MTTPACKLCGHMHRPLPDRCSAGLETVADRARLACDRWRSREALSATSGKPRGGRPYTRRMAQLTLITADGHPHYVQLKDDRTRDQTYTDWRDRKREFDTDWIETVNGDLIVRSSVARVFYIGVDDPRPLIEKP